MIRRFIYQSLTLACSVIAIGVAPAQADVVTSGSWQYDGSKIVKHLGDDITVTVPSSLDGQSITSNIPQLSVIPIPSLGVDEVDVNFNNEFNNN